MNKPKILILDIETSPNLAYVWGKYEQDVIEYHNEWNILSFSAKWLNGKQVTKGLCDYKDKTDKSIVSDLHKFLDEADIVVAHNGDQFDIRKIQARFSFYKMLPPSPFKTVDTKKVAKKYFAFNSNSLNDLGQHLGIGKKFKHQGFELWLGCMNGDKKSWDIMKKYNKIDVILLEKIYLHFLPYMTNHPNYGIYKDEEVCPNCGSHHLQSRGFAVTLSGKYRRFQCQDCGKWSRSKQQDEKLTILTNA